MIGTTFVCSLHQVCNSLIFGANLCPFFCEKLVLPTKTLIKVIVVIPAEICYYLSYADDIGQIAIAWMFPP